MVLLDHGRNRDSPGSIRLGTAKTQVPVLGFRNRDSTPRFGYNYCYSNGPVLLDAVNSFSTTDNGRLIEVLEGHEDAVTSITSNRKSMQIASGLPPAGIERPDW
jgi:hypothetical protein